MEPSIIKKKKKEKQNTRTTQIACLFHSQQHKDAEDN